MMSICGDTNAPWRDSLPCVLNRFHSGFHRDCIGSRWYAPEATGTPVAQKEVALRAIMTLCDNAKPGNERVVLDNIRDVAEAALKGRKEA
jgi:hypothetical protein